MKITRRQLKKIIQEEVSLLQEQSYAPSYLLDFAKAYAGLDYSAREQLDKVASQWYTGIPGEEQARRMISDRQSFGGLRAVLDALRVPTMELDGSDSKDLQELIGAIRDEYSEGGRHPRDTDGDGNVDWSEIEG